jgi:hypothetical protein
VLESILLSGPDFEARRQAGLRPMRPADDGDWDTRAQVKDFKKTLINKSKAMSRAEAKAAAKLVHGQIALLDLSQFLYSGGTGLGGEEDGAQPGIDLQQYYKDAMSWGRAY